MTARLAIPAILCVAAAVHATTGAPGQVDSRAGGAGSVLVIGPPGSDTIRSVTPTFTVRTVGFTDAERPLTLRLQLARDTSFTALEVDTAVIGDSATITLTRPLPEGIQLFWRAIARTSTGDSAVSIVTGPRPVTLWVSLVTLNSPTGATVETSRPAFVWKSAQVSSPPGPWVFDIEILNAGTGLTVVKAAGLADTTFVPATDLESNVSYRWAVTARLQTGESTRRESAGTFVIVGTGAPRVTVLFPNFPNPFPIATTMTTCIWFDLREAGAVRLEVFDIRGSLVRTLVPSEAVASPMPAGRYGRATTGDGDGAGCDERFSWDGTARDGRVVPSGVYLLRLRANGIVSTQKMLFRGR